jgi:hypothetical protein
MAAVRKPLPEIIEAGYGRRQCDAGMEKSQVPGFFFYP